MKQVRTIIGMVGETFDVPDTWEVKNVWLYGSKVVYMLTREKPSDSKE